MIGPKEIEAHDRDIELRFNRLQFFFQLRVACGYKVVKEGVVLLSRLPAQARQLRCGI